MKVILLKDVKNQGKKDDIIEVSTGYANNYLLKNKLAVAYSSGSKMILDQELKEKKETEDAFIEACNDIKKALNEKSLEFKVKTGENDKVFGSVSTKQISEALLNDGFKIDKKNIFIKGPIDSLGNHVVKVKLHKKVEFNINIKLVK